MAKDLTYFKKTVPYTVVVRRSVLDNQGISMNQKQPWMAIPTDDLLDFKLANKKLIMDGVIVPTESPSVDWDTPNALSDADMDELLKSYLKLKATLKTLDSVPTLSRLLERAREQDKSDKIKNLIRERFAEVSDDEILSPNEMAGVAN